MCGLVVRCDTAASKPHRDATRQGAFRDVLIKALFLLCEHMICTALLFSFEIVPNADERHVTEARGPETSFENFQYSNASNERTFSMVRKIVRENRTDTV